MSHHCLGKDVMRYEKGSRSSQSVWGSALAFAVIALLTLPALGAAQLTGVENGNWTYLGGDAGNARYTHGDEITASNFGDLEVAWIWDNASFGPSTHGNTATPTYIDGMLITVTNDRRHVIALDPVTGLLKWTFTEPNTFRYEYSMRKGYGKGVAYGEVDGRGVIFITTPGFFLHALDAETGQPLEGWGEGVPIDGFPTSGSVDLVEDLIEGWAP